MYLRKRKRKVLVRRFGEGGGNGRRDLGTGRRTRTTRGPENGENRVSTKTAVLLRHSVYVDQNEC